MYNCFKPQFLFFSWLLSNLLLLPAPAQEYLVSVQHYSVPQGLSSRYTWHVTQDRQGFIWVATNLGLNRFDGFEFRQYPAEKHGFRSNEHERAYPGRRGRLWLISPMPLATTAGRFIISTPQQVKKNGIPHEEFNFSSHYQAGDGRLFFGGLKGVAAFYPKDFYQQGGMPPPQLAVS